MLHNTKLKLRELFTTKAETDRFSKVENLIEGLLVYILIVYFVWLLIVKQGSLLEDVLRTLLLVYICALGPLLHGNKPEDLGIGNIRLLKQQLFNRKKPGIIVTAIVLVTLSILVFPLFVERFELVLKLVPVLGALNDFVAVNASWLQIPLVIAEYVLFQIVLILFLIRKDNLWPSIRSMAKPFLVQLGVVFAMSLVTLELFRVEGTFIDFLAIWYGYTFWGLMQQIPFLVYLSTRFRNGFPYKRASEFVNVGLLAFFFGMFHAPQWQLVVVAFMMELFLARSFLHDDTRNLFVAGMVHGFFGTMAIFFTGLYIKMDFV